MSVTRITSIHCDGCSRWEEANIGESTAQLRRALRKVGWHANVKRPSDGFVMDFCPTCIRRSDA